MLVVPYCLGCLYSPIPLLWVLWYSLEFSHMASPPHPISGCSFVIFPVQHSGWPLTCHFEAKLRHLPNVLLLTITLPSIPSFYRFHHLLCLVNGYSSVLWRRGPLFHRHVTQECWRLFLSSLLFPMTTDLSWTMLYHDHVIADKDSWLTSAVSVQESSLAMLASSTSLWALSL